jgi:hypothetical protein
MLDIGLLANTEIISVAHMFAKPTGDKTKMISVMDY